MAALPWGTAGLDLHNHRGIPLQAAWPGMKKSFSASRSTGVHLAEFILGKTWSRATPSALIPNLWVKGDFLKSDLFPSWHVIIYLRPIWFIPSSPFFLLWVARSFSPLLLLSSLSYSYSPSLSPSFSFFLSRSFPFIEGANSFSARKKGDVFFSQGEVLHAHHPGSRPLVKRHNPVNSCEPDSPSLPLNSSPLSSVSASFSPPQPCIFMRSALRACLLMPGGPLCPVCLFCFPDNQTDCL